MSATPSRRVLHGATSSPFVFAPLRSSESLHADPVPEPEEPVGPPQVSPEALADAEARAREEALAEAATAIANLETALEEAEAAANAARADAEEARKSVSDATDRLSKLWAESIRELEPQLVDLAITVAESVLSTPLAEHARAAVERAIADAVDRLATDQPVTVTLHPVDLLYLQESGFAGTLSGSHAMLRWEPDASLSPGDWTVTSPEAAVRRVASDILSSLRESLGLHFSTTG